ncbi:AraC family transcriptional regulator [Marinilabiliaceae bacterium JC017]|nr:AraC family transcriptional regulator [Marinilabiliaceae bacterium JC017]
MMIQRNGVKRHWDMPKRFFAFILIFISVHAYCGAEERCDFLKRLITIRNDFLSHQKDSSQLNYYALMLAHPELSKSEVQYLMAGIMMRECHLSEAVELFQRMPSHLTTGRDSVINQLSKLSLAALGHEDLNPARVELCVESIINGAEWDQKSIGYLIAELKEISYRFRNRGNYDSALLIMNTLLSYFDELIQPQSRITLLGQKFFILKDQGFYEAAQEIGIQCIEICEEHQLVPELINAYDWFCWLYVRMEEYDLALEYADISIETAKKNNLFRLLSLPYNIKGCVYTRLKNDSAIYYLKEAAKVNKALNRDTHLGFNYCNIAEVFNMNGVLDSAEYYGIEALKLHEGARSYVGIGNDHTLLGCVYMQSMHFKEAEKHYKAALDAVQITNFRASRQQLFKSLSDCFEKQGRLSESIYYLKKYQQSHDSLINHGNKTAWLKRELDSRLKKIGELKKQVNNVRNNKAINVAGIVLLLIALVGFVIWRYKRLHRKIVPAVGEPGKRESKVLLNKTRVCDSGEMDLKEGLILDEFISYITEDKKYLQSDLNIEQIAKAVNTNRTYLSRAINQKYGESYTYVINKYRIEEACRILKEGKHDHLTIEGIANIVGFKSKTSFTNTFKKFKNQTPGVFKCSCSQNIDAATMPVQDN